MAKQQLMLDVSTDVTIQIILKDLANTKFGISLIGWKLSTNFTIPEATANSMMNESPCTNVAISNNRYN